MTNGIVLVIEDNADNLALVRYLLERANYTVLAADNGISGLEIARMQKPDMVILDLTLPELDGWHVAELLKSHLDTQHIPVVALTAHTLPGDRKRAFDSGCDAYITKPLDIPNFVNQINQLLIDKAPSD